MFGTRGPSAVVATALVFGGWTLFVWVGRLRNLVAEPGGLLDVSRWSLVGSIAFTVGGAAVVAAALARWRQGPLGRAGQLLAPAVLALGALTVVVWLIRAVDIALGDHSIGFIVVHLVLAVVSIGLAAAAATQVTGRNRRGLDSADTNDGRLPSSRWVSQ